MILPQSECEARQAVFRDELSKGSHFYEGESDMKLSAEDLTIAFCEHDFAMRAASYGSHGNRDVVLRALRNLPPKEFDALRRAVQDAIDAAVARTRAAIENLGVELDMQHPLHVRATYDGPDISIFERKAT